jgi:hypothetical protein
MKSIVKWSHGWFKGRGSWVRRHHSFWVVLGAAIVFLTFVVKEGLRENAKDALEDLTIARVEYRAERNQLELLQAIDDLSKGPGEDSEEKVGWYEDEEKLSEWGEWQKVERVLSSAKHESFQASSLIKNLPPSEEIRKLEDNLNEKQERMNDAVNHAYNTLT